MNLYKAVMIAEGFGEGIEATAEQQREAWQYLIDSGDVWKLQGWYGRTATSLIEQGICTMPGKSERRTTERRTATAA
jgi:hypothetical protein